MIAIALIFLATGLVIFLVSLPLIYRKIPMNRFYGIRTRSAFKSNEAWYEINSHGGKQLANWSWLITVTGLVGLFLPNNALPAYAFAGAGIALLAAFAPLIQTLLWNRKRDI